MEQMQLNDLKESSNNQQVLRSGVASLLTMPQNLNKLLYNKYGEIEEDYNNLYLDALIFSKSSHIFTQYKDHLTWNYIDEFLKRYYSNDETKERLPMISNYYKNYLKFFCSPLFRNLKLNDIIQTYGDNKAEVYYKKTYSKKKINNNALNENADQNSNNSSSSSNNKKGDFSTLFNTTIKQNIDENILTESCQDSLLNFSTVLNKNDFCTRRSKEDSIEKILANLGVDINGRFKTKATKSKKNIFTKNTFSTVDKTDKADKVTSMSSKRGKSISTPNKCVTKNVSTVKTTTASVSPFHTNYVGNIINVVNIGVNMGNVGVNLMGNSVGVNTVTKIKSSDFTALYNNNFQGVTNRPGAAGNNKVSFCTIYKANPWQQVKPPIKINSDNNDRNSMNKKHTINDFRKRKHSSMLCESQHINSSTIRTNKIETILKSVRNNKNYNSIIISPKDTATSIDITNRVNAGKSNIFKSISPPPQTSHSKININFNANKKITNVLKSSNLLTIHKRENSSKFANFIDCTQKLLNANYKSPGAKVSRNTQSTLLKLSTNPIKKSVDKKYTNLQEFLKNQKQSISKIDNVSQSRKVDVSSRILNLNEERRKSLIELPVKDKTRKVINLYTKTMKK
jgi:hypothetical protein